VGIRAVLTRGSSARVVFPARQLINGMVKEGAMLKGM
jgi:hypothetical protein